MQGDGNRTASRSDQRVWRGYAQIALIVVEAVQPRPTAQALTGTVDVRDRVTIMSEVAGRVVWLSREFTEGGFEAAGETLVRIDPAGYELAVAEAQAVVPQPVAETW